MEFYVSFAIQISVHCIMINKLENGKLWRMAIGANWHQFTCDNSWVG